MNRLDRLVDNKVAQNILVWVFVFLIALVSIQAENVVLTALSAVTFIAIPVYINNLKIVPLLLGRRKALGGALFLLNVAFFTLIGVYFASNYLVTFEWRMVYNLFGILLLVLFFSSSIKLARDSFTRRQEEKDAELKLLKAQLNPHFLFNTLNNLYGLSVVKSDKLPNLMLKLSDLLRYSLYDTKETFVPLGKEVQYLENYMSLEKIRLEDKTDIQFKQEGNYESQEIAPMLLIVFVENAFKHLGKTSLGENYVQVSLQISENTLRFNCINTIDPNSEKYSNIEKGKSGIGLQNAKKRLALMYPEKYKLQIDHSEEKYNVSLTLQL